MRILFVCLGNICRSPAAEGVFKHLVAERGLEKEITCDSAGTAGYHEGEGAYPKMKKIAFKRGYDLTSISRPVRPKRDFEEFDLIIGMDDQNVADLTRMAPEAKSRAKIRKMTDYCTRLRHKYVPDPYYGESRDYELVIDILEDSCAGLLEFIATNDLR
ncbi:MAG: low molecular weight protein-tyrosine-phosphatase [Prolixibacteraceae bacterium]